MNMKVLFLLCFAAFGFLGVSAQQERFVKPVDEAATDASFVAFRGKLIAAAKRRDAKYILSILDKDIKNGFGGNDGIAEFKKQWKIESPASKFWDEFMPVIANGGKFDEGGEVSTTALFTAPYTFNGFP